MKEKVVEIKVGGETKYCPAYEINGKDHLVSHQDHLVYYDTEKEAKEYFEE